MIFDFVFFRDTFRNFLFIKPYHVWEKIGLGHKKFQNGLENASKTSPGKKTKEAGGKKSDPGGILKAL